MIVFFLLKTEFFHLILGDVIYTMGSFFFDQSYTSYLSKGEVAAIKFPNILFVQGLVFPGCSGGAVIRKDGKMVGLLIGSVHFGTIPAFSQCVPIYPLYNHLMKFIKNRGKYDMFTYIHSNILRTLVLRNICFSIIKLYRDLFESM